VKIRAVIHDGRWRYLAAALDARLLLFVLFLAIFVLPFMGISKSSFLDRNLFKLGVKLQSQSVDARGYIRVDVPAEEMQRFLRDPVSATSMLAFLDQLKSSNMVEARLVLHEKLWTDYRMSALLEHANSLGSSVSPDMLQTLKKNIGVFQSFLTDRRITREQIGHGELPSAALFPAMPFFSVENGSTIPESNRYVLSRLMDQTALTILQNKTVVIGETGDSSADDLLLSAVSARSASVATFAPWFLRLHIAVMVFAFLYLIFMPFMPLRVSGFLSLVFVLALVLAQQIVFILHREWFPITQWLLFLLVGHLVVFLWCLRRSFYPSVEIPDMPVVNENAKVRVSGQKSEGGIRALFARKKPVVRVPPTMAGMSGSEYIEDAETLAKTQAIKRPAPKAPGTASSSRQYLGRYRIERELGRGAMGVVYLGFDPKISRKVAIKTLHYNQFDARELVAVKERFFREAAAAGKLRHPNIVTIYDAGEEADLAYIAMDYVEGDSLAAHIRKGHLLDVELVYYIMALVTDAVNDANSQGIIHRDIKPSNILYDSNTNEVKVADFGIARIMDGSATRTKTGDLVGSPLYMSPEQIKGEHVSRHSDIFSLGVTFYQLLTGELPFKGENLANLSYQIVQCKFRPVDEVRPGLPDSAKRIIAKALQKNPENRYDTAGEMHDALQRAYSRDFS
jgi:tRNA A-37 threonylcarbamoyl transferase component Bud32